MAEEYSRLERRLKGYNIFARETRKNILDSDPNKSFGEIAKLVGEKWRALDNEIKSIYNQRASVHNEQARQLISKQCPVEEPVVGQKQMQKPSTATNNQDPSSSTRIPKPRPISGYLIFAHELGREIMSNDPNKLFCDITKLVAGQWKVMTSEMKRNYYKKAIIYNKQAKEKKSEPAKEEPLPSMKGSPPAKEIITFALRPKKKKALPADVEYSGKYWTKTDNCILIDEPEGPSETERHRTGYTIYSSEIRQRIVKRNPKRDSDYITKRICDRWRRLPVEEKLEYNQRALNYNKHMKEHSEQQQIHLSPKTKKAGPSKPKKVVKKVAAKPEAKIKKKRGRPPKLREPRNAARHISGYIVYSAEVRQQFKDSNPGREFGYLSKLIAEHWKALPENTKLFYRQKARMLNQQNRSSTQNELSA